MGLSRLLCVTCVLLCCRFASADPKTWQYDPSGKWKESTTRPTATAPAVNGTLDRAVQLILARQYDPAHDLLLDWAKANPKAPDRDRGLFLLANVYFVQGDRMWCYYQCDELLDNFPDSRLFFQAMELQYKVADDFLNGYKKRFLGLPLISMEDVGVDMMFRLQERSPGSPLAERALLRTGDYYYRGSQFDLAADAYGAYLRIYPRSEQIPRVRLRQAYANFAQFRGPRYDATPLLDARAEFQEIAARTPELAREEGVDQFIDRIDEQLAAKVLVDAEYYRRVNQPRAAVFLYRSLIQRYPNSREAQTAKVTLTSMPPAALAEAPPPSAAGQMPVSTRPTLGREYSRWVDAAEQSGERCEPAR